MEKDTNICMENIWNKETNICMGGNSSKNLVRPQTLSIQPQIFVPFFSPDLMHIVLIQDTCNIKYNPGSLQYTQKEKTNIWERKNHNKILSGLKLFQSNPS